MVAFRSGYSELHVWLFSTLLFMYLHAWNFLAGQDFGPTVAQLVFTFVVGSVLYAVRRATGTLIIPMMLHGGWISRRSPRRRMRSRTPRNHRSPKGAGGLPSAHRDDRALRGRLQEGAAHRRHDGDSRGRLGGSCVASGGRAQEKFETSVVASIYGCIPLLQG